jgi:hypothetical protein
MGKKGPEEIGPGKLKRRPMRGIDSLPKKDAQKEAYPATGLKDQWKWKASLIKAGDKAPKTSRLRKRQKP